VITAAGNGNNITDIHPAKTPSWPIYRGEEFLILGHASDYWEALEVAGTIISDMYRKTGGFDLPDFIGLEAGKVGGVHASYYFIYT